MVKRVEKRKRPPEIEVQKPWLGVDGGEILWWTRQSMAERGGRAGLELIVWGILPQNGFPTWSTPLLYTPTTQQSTVRPLSAIIAP
jgi:hypothetical protein